MDSNRYRNSLWYIVDRNASWCIVDRDGLRFMVDRDGTLDLPLFLIISMQQNVHSTKNLPTKYPLDKISSDKIFYIYYNSKTYSKCVFENFWEKTRCL